MDIQLGAPCQILPPVDRGISLGIKMEELGYDALWWPDHLMGWHPDAMWNEDFTPLAKHQPSSRKLLMQKFARTTHHPSATGCNAAPIAVYDGDASS